MGEPTAHDAAGPGPLEDLRFGGIAVWGGLVTAQELEEALAEQRRARGEGGGAGRIGELLAEAGRLTGEEVRRVLRVQLQRLPAEGHALFGTIATARGFSSPDEVERALDEQSRDILAGRPPRRVGEILVAGGSIGPDGVEAILAFQASRDSVPISAARRPGATGRGPGREAAATGAGEGDQRPPRPGFLPRGAWGFVLDHSIWITLAAAAAAAAVLIVYRDAIFL